MNERSPASVSPVPGQPGVYVNEATGEVFKLVEFRDDSKYDAVEILTSDVTSGASKEFFAAQTDKNEVDTNVDTPRRLSQGETMVIRWVGIEYDQGGYDAGTPYFGASSANAGTADSLVADLKRVSSFGYLSIQINKIMIAEGALAKFPAGYGLWIASSENNQGVASIGMPATSGRRDLEKQHFVTSQHSLKGTLKFQTRNWLTTDPTTISLDMARVLRLHLGGLVSAAATK